jgi:hypothetical protein
MSSLADPFPSTTTDSSQKADSQMAVPCRLPVYTACTLLGVALALMLGKDMPWDELHYHFYAGFSALNDRFGQDYFAAGAQSYFNPYAYVPFYVLAKSGLPGIVVSTVLAVIQSAILWITYELAGVVCASESRQNRILFVLFATTLAFMNPVLLQQFGSSFADVTTAELILGGWLLLAKTVQSPSTKRVVFAALLMGFATALKPTNGIHALAAFLVVGFVPLSFPRRLRNLVCFGTALGFGFVLTAAPWSYRLARMFGNPMFPLLNNLFESPEFTTAPLKHYRFIPGTLGEALVRPFEMASTTGMIHEELTSPDIRYALLLSSILILGIAYFWRSLRHASNPPVTLHVTPRDRVLLALGCGFGADWLMWLYASGNSRYFIPMACVAAVLATAVLFRLLQDHPGGLRAILFTLLVAQGAQLFLGADYRWNRAPWIGRWFNVEIPEKLASEPNLYLSIGMESNSYIVPFLARGSGVVNFAGGYALGPDGANAARVHDLISRRTPHLRVLVAGDRIYENSFKREPRRSDVDDALSTFGLRVDMSDCDSILIRGLPRMIWRPLGSTIPPPLARRCDARNTSSLASCRVVANNADNSAEMSARKAVDVVFNRLEDACPDLFQPPRLQTEHINDIWLRTYQSTDLTAFIERGQLEFVDPTRGGHRNIHVGSESAWAKARVPVECGRRHGVYFAVVRSAPQ